MGPAALTLPAHEETLDAPLLHELSRAIAGPFHVLRPERFDANLTAFRAALAQDGVRGRVYFAKKANKAAVFAERCATAGAGVDVASHGELAEALANGVRGEQLVVTGPAKARRLLCVALLHGSLITADAPDELERLIALARELGTTARTLLRRRPPAQPDSRFGFEPDALRAALPRCREAADWVWLEGFSVHLRGYSIQARADAAGDLLDLCHAARAQGLAPEAISIGGGFPVDYTTAEAWEGFLAANAPVHYHAGKTFGANGFYPYHSPVAGADALRAILAARPGGEPGPTVAERLREEGIALLVEPGRALLDRAGCSVFRIQGVKDRDDYGIVTVDGTSLSLSEQWFGSEFLPEPVLLALVASSPSAPGRRSASYRACVGGASCLDVDLLTWRKIAFPARPAPGDLLVYPNTAGYQMDSNESPFHDLPLPPKVVLDRHGWRFDHRPSVT